MATVAAPTGAIPPTTRAHTQLVVDALILLDFAHDVVATIEATAGKLGLTDIKAAPVAVAPSATTPATAPAAAPAPATTPDGKALTAEEWAAFDFAYYDLAKALSPVTAETLRNTAGETGTWTLYKFLCGNSPAVRFTRVLWVFTLGFAAFVIVSQGLLQVWAFGDTDPKTHIEWRSFFELLTPWAYGGLGSCIYLLRSAHSYIWQRTFDIRRKPEYLNRILLGTMAGGAIILFVNNIAGEDGTAIQLSSAALGFLSGYSTDFLFNTIERIIAAILPKGNDDTATQQPEAATKPVDINDLAKRIETATGPEKEIYKAAIAKLVGIKG
jgi:hypothetical protein